MSLILGIETSCDETACAIVKDGKEILSSVVSSQINVHTKFGGVVPEVASRIHVENISTVIEEALTKANVTMDDVDAIGYTRGPGLIGSLHVGVQAAKTLAFAYHKPLVPVNHMCGHIYANQFIQPLQFPLLALVVSGGHSQLVWMEKDYDFQIIGETQDDAIGEAYDKVSRVLGTGYPGGPIIDKMAKNGKPHYDLPIIHVDGEYNFSFSGLKSAVLQCIQKEQRKGNEIINEDIAYAFQERALAQLIGKTMRAVENLQPKMVVLAGGVAANSRLRELMKQNMEQYPDKTLIIPPMYCCTDNAAMIASVADVAYRLGHIGDYAESADPSMEMPNEE